MTVFEGASSGLLSRGRHRRGERDRRARSAVGILVYENVWAAPFAAALRRGGAQLVRKAVFRCKRSWPRSTRPRAQPDANRTTTTNEREIAVPGLLRGMARTAVIAGTATAVSNRVSRRQAGRWAEQDQQQYAQQQYAQPAPQPVYAAPPPAADATSNRLAQLQQLADLKTQGILTDAEFEAQKAKILAG